jgi:general secretion pathway protein K
MALLVAITAVAILSVMLAELHQTTTTGYLVAATERDTLRAEYMAKSGLNLTRLLISKEPAIRRLVAPIYTALLQGQAAPQIPVWSYANILLQPFCNFEEAKASSGGSAIDFRNAEGLDGAPGTCEIVSFSENSRININNALFLQGNAARLSTAEQLFALMGGNQSPSPYDPLFSQPDDDGLISSRQVIASAIIDWWDYDTTRTDYDPGAREVNDGGSEDDVYGRFDDPYKTKNAPFDSLEELRLVRGISDDFWATFIEPKPEDPSARVVTIYGSGMVNPNEAPPQVLLARVCSYIPTATLCTSLVDQTSFITLVDMVRNIAPVPFFSTPNDFLEFIQGRGFLYTSLQGIPQLAQMGLVFTPVAVPAESSRALSRAFITRASIITVYATGKVGRAEVNLHAVLNFHSAWHPPPPLSGRMPALGIYHYYRIE